MWYELVFNVHLVFTRPSAFTDARPYYEFKSTTTEPNRHENHWFYYHHIVRFATDRSFDTGFALRARSGARDGDRGAEVVYLGVMGVIRVDDTELTRVEHVDQQGASIF